MIEELKNMCEELTETGSLKSNPEIMVIEEIWEDGGGCPIYLEDIIHYFDNKD